MGFRGFDFSQNFQIDYVPVVLYFDQNDNLLTFVKKKIWFFILIRDWKFWVWSRSRHQITKKKTQPTIFTKSFFYLTMDFWSFTKIFKRHSEQSHSQEAVRNDKTNCKTRYWYINDHHHRQYQQQQHYQHHYHRISCAK